MWIPILLFLIVASLVYQLGALVCLWRIVSRPWNRPVASCFRGITVFKPVKGLEPETRECLESFLRQEYQPYQVLFGVACAHDPVMPLLMELKAEWEPQVEVEVVVCPAALGENPKVSVLRQLEPYARYGRWVIADGDVKVGPDFLTRAAQALEEPGVGLVSCLYRAGPAFTLGSKLEALTISADFIPSVAVAEAVEGVRFALGAAMILRRQALEAIGGLAAVADFLADDYQLGWRLHQAGLKVGLWPYVVETVNPWMSFREYLGHQARWTRTYRVCRPGGYLAYGLTHTLAFCLVLWLVSALAAWALGLLLAGLTVRLVLARVADSLCLKGHLPWPALLLLPLKDLLSFGLWLFSFVGQEVTWKGRRFGLTREGRLIPLSK
uniref:Ceramide glucosyltransferase n=1 Tax=Desulfobacca acetoxidans TaxID=60893 RepID=A0A7C5ALP1_9BACT